MVSDFLYDMEERFTLRRRHERPVLIFQRALVIFTLMKVAVLWSVSKTFLAYSHPTLGISLSKLIFLPSIIGTYYPMAFFIVISLALLAMLFLKPTHLTNFILFWIVINLLKIRFPVTNGSDYVLAALTFYNIFLSLADFYEEKLDILSTAGYNLAHLMARIQIALIYLISGWDKLFSHTWNTGRAFIYVANIETVYNPIFGSWMTNKDVSWFLSWAAIVFELAFAVLVWQKRTRLFILCVGVLFHLGIWLMLSLPDFALIMIISYLLFLRTSDLKRLGLGPKPSPL